MKLLVVSTDYLPNISGVATLTHEQAVGLQNLGHEVRVLTSTAEKMDAELTSSVSVTRICTPGNLIWRLYNLQKMLLKEITEWGPDFIWCTTYRGFGVPAMRTAQRLGIRFGIYFHGTELLTENRFPRRGILKRVADGAQIVATNSRNSQKLLAKHYEIQSEVITPGVHIAPPIEPEVRTSIRRRWLKEMQGTVSEENAFILICACRITRAKGIDKAIEAIAALPESLRARCNYVILGEGPDRNELMQLSQQVGLAKQVHFAGPLDRVELPCYLAAADAYLQPSQPVGNFLESFGISYLEAQAAGLPCIATRFGGIPEVIKDGETGILVKPGSVAELRAALINVMNSGIWTSAAASAAGEWAKANQWTNHCYKLNALISV